MQGNDGYLYLLELQTRYGVCCWLFYNKPWFVIIFYLYLFCCVAAEHNLWQHTNSCCYPAAILPAILLLSCCYPAAILLLSCCYPAAILLLSWSPQLTLTTCALVIHHPEETYSYCFAAKQQWQCTRWYTWCISVKSGGTPDFTLHNRWYTYCGIAALA